MADERAPEGVERPQWWNAAKALGHLEERQGAATLLVSPGELN
jgi:protein HIRA/HIR1